MSRRFPDMRLTRERWTDGEAIAAGVGFLVAILTLLGAIALFAPYAHAWDGGQWKDSDAYIGQWFRTLKQPDNKFMSCCGEADAYWADKTETGPNDELIAVITDDRADEPLRRRHVPVGTRIVVPPHKIKYDQGNPTGHIIIFLSTSDEVWCYVQNGGV